VALKRFQAKPDSELIDYEKRLGTSYGHRPISDEQRLRAGEMPLFLSVVVDFLSTQV
jgi:hypothetical protein